MKYLIIICLSVILLAGCNVPDLPDRYQVTLYSGDKVLQQWKSYGVYFNSDGSITLSRNRNSGGSLSDICGDIEIKDLTDNVTFTRKQIPCQK